MTKRLILFDIDGTLLTADGAGRVSTRAAMLDVFGETGALDTHSFGGKTDWQTLTELLADCGYSAEAIGESMPAFEASIAGHLMRIMGNHTVRPCRGAMAAVDRLRASDGYLLGIVTGNVSTTAPVKLRAAGYDPDWFPVGAYGSEAVDRNKLPGMALERAIVYSGAALTAEDTVVIGDTPADIACARTLGATAVAVCTGFSPRERLAAAEPDYLLEDLRTLDDIL